MFAQLLAARRVSPATRGNLLIAAIPLGIALLTRGLDALEQHIHSRFVELNAIEARIAGRTAELAALSEPAAEDGEVKVDGADDDQRAEDGSSMSDLDSDLADLQGETPAAPTSRLGVYFGERARAAAAG